MSRLALLDRRLPLAFVALTCTALGACTEPLGEKGQTHLERHFEDSGQNYVLAFDGVDDYLTTGTAQFPDGRSNQTLSAWFMLDAAAGRQAILTLRKDFESGVELGVENGAVGVWRVFASNRNLALAKTAISLGVWHHVAFTSDAASNALYVDGVLVASSGTESDKRTPTTCWVGTLDGMRDVFKGSLDNVRVWSSVRTAEQIASEVASEPPSTDPNLVLDLPFNESGGALVFDHSGRENDGQLGDGVPLRMPKRVKSAAPRL